MSFEIHCKNCGAMSSPSVGMCPFCKGVFGELPGATTGGASELIKLYAAGKVENAVAYFTQLQKEVPNLDKDAETLLLAAKILLEAEGPLGTVKTLLIKAHLAAPESSEVANYLELLDAKEKLEFGSRELGEQALKNLLRRDPKNVHALFLLGSYLFWNRKESEMSTRYLQQCVSLRPAFLRAWACLGAIYKTTGHDELASRAFRKCLELETHPSMIQYFQNMIGKAA